MDPSNDPSIDNDSEGGLGKIRLVTPRPRFGGDCKDISTHRSTNSDSSGYVYDPI